MRRYLNMSRKMRRIGISPRSVSLRSARSQRSVVELAKVDEEANVLLIMEPEMSEVRVNGTSPITDTYTEAAIDPTTEPTTIPIDEAEMMQDEERTSASEAISERSAAESGPKQQAAKRPPSKEPADEPRDPPVLAALTITIGWIMASAGLFCVWEDWTYFTSFYFFFISLSTIGLGDVTPDYPEYMIGTFFIVLVGLSLVSVCINVVQEKCSIIFMRILRRMLEKFIEAQQQGDPEAVKDFVTGFNDKAKYLAPFISKSQGSKIMEQFKEEAKAQGVELPPALTEVDPETGKFSFMSAKEEIDTFIEKAQIEGKLAPATVRPAMVNAKTQTSAPRKRGLGSQTEVLPDILSEFSIACQYHALGSDAEMQTSDSESCDSGVQCWPSLEDVSTQFDESLSRRTIDAAVQWESTTTETGIQPEVSCIIQLYDDEGSEGFESDMDSIEGTQLEHSQLLGRTEDGAEAGTRQKRRRKPMSAGLRYMRSAACQATTERETKEQQAGCSFGDLVESSTHAVAEATEVGVQTAPTMNDGEIQTDVRECANTDTQTEQREFVEAEIQAVVETSEVALQETPTCDSNETQTLHILVDYGVQTGTMLATATCQTDSATFVGRFVQTRITSTVDPREYKKQQENIIEKTRNEYIRAKEERAAASKDADFSLLTEESEPFIAGKA